jgi:hypothetical protein
MAGVAAHTVVVVHLAYLLYVLLGGLLGLRNIRWLWPHSVTAFWAVVGLITQVRCPLTVLEKYLLVLDGTQPYSGTFIGHHVAGVFYPAAWEALVWYSSAVLVLTSYVVAFARHGASKRLAAH